MLRLLLLTLLICSSSPVSSATIAIIDTGFDLDHEFLKPKILRKETDEESIEFNGWDFFDNSHLKKPVIEDKSELQEVLLYRNLRAKGHRQGLSLEEFEWFKKKGADKEFMEKVRLFKKHSHGTFVAGIALREGENINIFPIRGLNLPNQVVAIEDEAVNASPLTAPRGRTPEEKFQEELRSSVDRVSKKFAKICQFLTSKKIEIVNASYGITYKNIMTKFRDRYKEMVGKDIEQTKLKTFVDDYFQSLYERGEKTMLRHENLLFIFSAGNSGLDNDLFHHYPSRIRVPNAITVAAMNGEYLATFSNYGGTRVDVGAPGVAVMSLLPKVYAQGADLYSPSSGTSMAAPYVSNLAAQIKNTNPRLSPPEIKRIILETGSLREHLQSKLSSASIVDNHRALRAALLSRDLPLDQAIPLGRSDVIPMEDKISLSQPPAVTPEEMQKKVLDSIPSAITPQEIDEEPSPLEATTPASSSPRDPEKAPQDSSKRPLSEAPAAQGKSSDPTPSSPTGGQSPEPSGELPASSSLPQSSPPQAQSPET